MLPLLVLVADHLHPVVVVAVAALEPPLFAPGVAAGAVHPPLVRPDVRLVGGRVAADVAHVPLALPVRDLHVLLDVPAKGRSW